MSPRQAGRDETEQLLVKTYPDISDSIKISGLGLGDKK